MSLQNNLPAGRPETSHRVTDGGDAVEAVSNARPVANVEIKFDREEYRRAMSEERRKHTKRVRSVLP